MATQHSPHSSPGDPAAPPARPSWIEPLLVVLSLWALAQALLVWSRPPAPPPPPLPARMQLQGLWLNRQPPMAPLAPVPPGMVIQSAADYLAPGSPRLLLRWVARTSSGDGARFEPDGLALALMGPKGRGSCRVYDDATGRLLGVGRTGAETKALLRRNDPDGLQRLEWALGLRPWRLNRCLFVGVLPQP